MFRAHRAHHQIVSVQPLVAVGVFRSAHDTATDSYQVSRCSSHLVHHYIFNFLKIYGAVSSEARQWEIRNVLIFGRIQYINLKVSTFLSTLMCVMSLQMCRSWIF